MEETDKEPVDIEEELRPVLTDLEKKVDYMRRLVELLTIIEEDGAGIYVDAPNDSNHIRVVIYNDEFTPEMAELSRIDKSLKGQANSQAEATYKYDNDEYEINKQFRIDL